MRRLILEEPYSKAAVWSRRIAVFALAVALMDCALSRLAAVDPVSALTVLGAALVLACLAGLLSVTAFVVIWRRGRGGSGLAAISLAIAAAMLAYPGYLSFQAISLPRLNEVSTDLDQPPSFLRSARALASRGGQTPSTITSENKTAQRAFYPKIQPILVNMEVNDAYQLALQAAKARGWKIIDAIAPSVREGLGHIDAADRSLFLGFVDDIAIRVEPLATQTRIDIRSRSRVWPHDFGANARHVEKFAEDVQTLARDK